MNDFYTKEQIIKIQENLPVITPCILGEITIGEYQTLHEMLHEECFGKNDC